MLFTVSARDFAWRHNIFRIPLTDRNFPAPYSDRTGLMIPLQFMNLQPFNNAAGNTAMNYKDMAVFFVDEFVGRDDSLR